MHAIMLFAFCHDCKVLSIPGGCAQYSRIYLYSVKSWGEKLRWSSYRSGKFGENGILGHGFGKLGNFMIVINQQIICKGGIQKRKKKKKKKDTWEGGQTMDDKRKI